MYYGQTTVSLMPIMKHENGAPSTLEPKRLEQDIVDAGHWKWKQCQRMV